MKPSSKAESRYAAFVIKHGNHKAYFWGNKPLMKRKLGKARRRVQKGLDTAPQGE